MNTIAMVGSSMRNGGSGLRLFPVGDGVADADVLDAGDGGNVAGLRRRYFDALEPLPAVDLGDFDRPLACRRRDRACTCPGGKEPFLTRPTASRPT